jgi:hypothetical protein
MSNITITLPRGTSEATVERVKRALAHLAPTKTTSRENGGGSGPS